MPGADDQDGAIREISALLRYLTLRAAAWGDDADPRTVATELDQDWELVRQSLGLAVERAETAREEARELCCDLFVVGARFLKPLLAPDEVLRWIEAGLPAAALRRDPTARGVHLALRAEVERDQSSLTRARASYEEALSCFTPSRQPAWTVRCLTGLGMVLALCGDLRASRARLRKARALCERGRDARGLMLVAGSESIVEGRARNFAAARRAAREYLRRAERRNDVAQQVTALGQLGTCDRRLAEADEEAGRTRGARTKRNRAADCYRRQKALAERIGDVRSQQRATGNLGNVYGDLGRFDDAEACYRDSMSVWLNLGDRRAMANDQVNLGSLCVQQTRYAEADSLFLEALSCFRSLGDESLEATTLWNLSESAAGQGNLADAIRLAGECLAIRERHNDPRAGRTREAVARWQAEAQGEPRDD